MRAIITVHTCWTPPNDKVVLFFTNGPQCHQRCNNQGLESNTSNYLKWRYTMLCVTWVVEPFQIECHNKKIFTRVQVNTTEFNQIACSSPSGMFSTNNTENVAKRASFCNGLCVWLVSACNLAAIFTFHSRRPEFISLPLPHIIHFWGFWGMGTTTLADGNVFQKVFQKVNRSIFGVITGLRNGNNSNPWERCFFVPCPMYWIIPM